MRNIRFFYKEDLIRYPAIVSGFCIIFQIVLIALTLSPKGESISLHYTTYFGVDFIGARYLIYGIPAIAFFISVGNAALGLVMSTRNEKLFAYMLSVGAAVISLLLTLAVLLLLRLNV